MRLSMFLSFAVALASLSGFASAQTILFEEDFEGVPAAFTLVGDADDEAGTGGVGTDIFDSAFAYTDLGDSTDVRSGTGGRLITENALTAYIPGVTVDGSTPVSIKYDLYADPNSSGSTEYAFVGVGDATLPFQHYLRGSLIGTEETQGVFAGGLTDSDTALDGDYVILEGDGSVGSPVDLFNADAALNAQFGVSFSDILPPLTPGPSGESTPGRVLQHRWVEVELLIAGDLAVYSFNGQRVAAVTASGPITGSIGFGIGDPFPSSNQGMRAIPTPDTNIIIDNIVVTAIPEPSVLALAGIAGLFAACRRR